MFLLLLFCFFEFYWLLVFFICLLFMLELVIWVFVIVGLVCLFELLRL